MRIVIIYIASLCWLLSAVASPGEVSRQVLGFDIKDRILQEQWGDFLAMRAMPQWGFLEGRPQGEIVRILKTYNQSQHAYFAAFPQAVPQSHDVLEQFDRELWYLFQSYANRRGFTPERISGFVNTERHLNALMTVCFRYRSHRDLNLIPDSMLRIVDGTQNALGGPLLPVENGMKIVLPERSEIIRVNGRRTTPAVIEIGRTIKRPKGEPGDAEKATYALMRILYEVGGYIDRLYLSKGRPAVVYIHTETIGKEIFGREPYGFEWQSQYTNSDNPDEVVMRMDGEEFIRRFGSSRELDFILRDSELESMELGFVGERVFVNPTEVLNLEVLQNTKGGCEQALVLKQQQWPWIRGTGMGSLEDFNPASPRFAEFVEFFQKEAYQTTPQSRWLDIWSQKAPFMY